MRAAFHYWEPLAVRWGDMDALGHVNHTLTLRYCEQVRIGYFKRVGMSELVPGISEGPILARISCDYHRPLSYPQQLDIGVRCTKLGNKSFHLEHAIFEKKTDDPSAVAVSIIVWFDYHSEQTKPLPNDVVGNIKQLDGL